MKYGTTILLLIAALALGAYIWFVERKGETTEKREELARYALNVDAAAVTRFSLITDTLQITVQKEGEQWILTSPVRTRADAGAVGQFLDELQRLPKGEVITVQEMTHDHLTLSSYGLDRPRIRIEIGTPANRQVLLVGADAKLGGALYIKEESRNEVISTGTNLLSVVPRNVTDIRDRRLFDGQPADVTRIAVKRSDGFVELAKTEKDGWRIQKPVASRAAEPAVQDLLDKLFAVRISDFVAESVAAAPLYGLDEPAVQVTLSSKSGEQTLLLGRHVERALDQTYAMIQGAEEVFAVPTNIIATLQFRTDALRDRRLITLPAFDIAYVEIQQGERALKLVKSNGVWSVTEPKQFKADEGRVQVVLSEWTGAKVQAYNDEPVTNLVELGFVPPARKLVLARQPPAAAGVTNASPQADGDVATILVSSADAGHDRFMVSVAGESSLYLIETAPVHALSVDPLTYRDHEMMTLDPGVVRSITIQSAGQQQSVERDATNDLHAVDAGRSVDVRSVAALLSAVRSLRALDLVAEDVSDLSPYGLDVPTAVLTFGLPADAGLGKTVLFGGAAGEGYMYAMIKGQDVVFTLEKALAETLTAALYKEQAAAPVPEKVESPDQSPAPGP